MSSGGDNIDGEDYRPYSVIPSLMDLLSEAVDDAKDKRQASVGEIYRELAERLTKSERQVRRYFDDESGCTIADLDALVAAVAAIRTEKRDRRSFWHQAMRSVDDEVMQIGLDPWESAFGASQKLPPPEAPPPPGG